MKWLKDVVLDITITLIALIYAIWQPGWAWWVLVIYTPLMALLKGVALANPMLADMASKKRNEVPFWFHHVLYAVSVLSLLTARWYLMAGLWIAIWLMSIVTDSRVQTASALGRNAPKEKKGKFKPAQG